MLKGKNDIFVGDMTMYTTMYFFQIPWEPDRKRCKNSSKLKIY